jgi:hypothetical protein
VNGGRIDCAGCEVSTTTGPLVAEGWSLDGIKVEEATEIVYMTQKNTKQKIKIRNRVLQRKVDKAIKNNPDTYSTSGIRVRP